MQIAKQILLATWTVSCLAFTSSIEGQPAQSATAARNTPITPVDSPKGWRIETQSSVYQIALASDNIVVPVYFGPRGIPAQVEWPRVNVDPKRGSPIREVPYRGGFVKQTPAVEVVFSDLVRDCELAFDSSAILEIEGYPTLRIDLKDPVYGLFVSAYIRVFPDLDVLEKWLVLENTGDAPIQVENAQSGSVMLPADDYDLVHLAGEWANEFMLHRTRLTPGVKTIQTRDFVAHANPPWFAVRPTGQTSETVGPVWFGSLHYSGNWRLDFEKMFKGPVQITGGINFWDTTWRLERGKEFVTPKIVFGLAVDGMGGASRRMHAYVRGHVLPDRYRKTNRPVLYNSWYATTFDVNEEHQLALAKVAKEIGVELFVIDDGWFKGRVTDRAGLGDWSVDRNKFPAGLQPMIQKINDMGLDFGIWVEPEMVNPDSDLYREHPDWVLHFPNRTRHESRHQLMLNLARDDVCEYLLESLSTLLRENNIRFIKWDRNREISEPGWPDAPPAIQREVRIRFVNNLYQLIDELRRRFPDVWFESCSGGGGRVDLGILARMDQVWTSDNTDPVDRLMIQHGFLHALPANTMVSWVTDEDWHQGQPPLEFRFRVCMAGVLGVGNDITKWTDDERKLAATMIALYKELRPLVQHGIVHRLSSPLETERVALEYVSADATEAVLFVYNLRDYLKGSDDQARSSGRIHLRGLDPEAHYVLSGGREGVISGRTLMEVGLPWFTWGNFESAIVVLRKQ